MNEVLSKILLRALLMPKVKSQVDKIIQVYCRTDLSNIKEEFKLYGILRTAYNEGIEIAEEIPHGADAIALEKLVKMVLRQSINAVSALLQFCRKDEL